MQQTQLASPDSEFRKGLLCGIGAYVWWGLVSIYFKLLSSVPATVVVAHRIVWSVLLLAAILTFARQWPQVRAAAAERRVWPWLGASTVLIGVNWLVFVYAVATNRLVESSLGYFINPLVTVLLGLVVLKERLRPAQWVAVVIAATGLAYLTVARAANGGFPWIAAVLPFSFGLYGLLRKQAPVGALAGLFIETLLLAPVSAAYLLWWHTTPAASAHNTPGTLGLLALAGIITTVPMIWFIGAARRLTLVTLSFVQYINPTMQFLVAVFLFHEPFDRDRAVTFAFIWLAVAIFVVDSLRRARAASTPPAR